MRRIVAYVVTVAALVAAAVWIANEPGAVTLEWRGWQLETSVGVLAVLVLLVVAALVGLLRILAWLRGTAQAYALRRRERRLQRGLVALGDGFAAVHAGHGATARRLAREAGNLLGESPAVLMLRKQAAALDGDSAEFKSAAQALLERPETEQSALRALAAKATADGDVAGAMGYARRAMVRGEAPAWAVHLLLDGEIAQRHWSEAVALVDSTAGRDIFSVSEQQRLRGRLLLLQAQDELNAGQAVAAAKTARRAIDAAGGTAAICVYARAMAAQGKGRRAAADIETAWTQAASPALLQAYRALVPGETALDWARRVEHLVQGNPDHAESRLASAEAALGAELWGRARNRLQGLNSDLQAPEVRARAARLMAEIENGERGDVAAVARWLREALNASQVNRVSAAPPRSAAGLLAEG